MLLLTPPHSRQARRVPSGHVDLRRRERCVAGARMRIGGGRQAPVAVASSPSVSPCPRSLLQYVCVVGVYRLNSYADALTVNVALTVRREHGDRPTPYLNSPPIFERRCASSSHSCSPCGSSATHSRCSTGLAPSSCSEAPCSTRRCGTHPLGRSWGGRLHDAMLRHSPCLLSQPPVARPCYRCDERCPGAW